MREKGGDILELYHLAKQEERSGLTAALKSIGFTKLGARKQVEQTFIEQESRAGSGTTSLTRNSGRGWG